MSQGEGGGRPPHYKTVEELQKKIDEYFANPPDNKLMFFKLKDEVVEKEVPCLTITGLALYLGFCNRQSMYDYENRPKFSDTIKKARSFIENEYEKLLQQGNPAGAIFALKNFGWSDRQEVEMSGEVKIKTITGMEIIKENENTIQNKNSTATFGQPVLDR